MSMLLSSLEITETKTGFNGKLLFLNPASRNDDLSVQKEAWLKGLLEKLREANEI
jgi:hypothetical protein